MKKYINLLFIAIVLNCFGCVAVFMPSKQKITINTKNKDARVYVDNEEFGKGSSIKSKVKKSGSRQVIIQTPDYKDDYYVLLPTKRPIAYWPCILLDIPFLYGLAIDPLLPKGVSYNAVNEMPCTFKYTHKTSSEKYIDLIAIKMDIANKDKDILYYTVAYSDNLKASFEKEEKDKAKQINKQELKNKKKGKNLLVDEENQMKYDDTKYSENIYKTLRETGYVDTINKVFADNNNTVGLEGIIKRVGVFSVYGKQGAQYTKAKIHMIWVIKNSFGEVLDSIRTEDFSGEFAGSYYSSNYAKMYADAVNISYLSLMKNPKFTKYLQAETNFGISDAQLLMNRSKKHVQDLSDAATACVIVKRKDGGHGSGFAITNDGYIITNFHVIAGDYLDKVSELKVILTTGEELPVKVVRYNRMRDIALLKVDEFFEKPFEILNAKSFKNNMEIYTVGAPKSIELGQSVSMGLLSNERKSNNNNLLQLSMSVNAGNSGGPLFDKAGTLHGVVSSKLVGRSTEGVSFAIPSYLLSDYLNIGYK